MNNIGNFALSLQVACNPQVITRGSTQVTVVDIIAVGPGVDQAWVGKQGYIAFYPGERYFFVNRDIEDFNYQLAPILSCSFIHNTCVDDTVNIRIVTRDPNVNPSNNLAYILNFPIGTEFMYYNDGLSITLDDWQLTAPIECSPPVPCIGGGQYVSTPNGTTLIDNLRTGDLIMTNDGREVEIVMDHVFVPITTECNAPILIPAHTFSENMPPVDVILSPNHVMMIKPDVWDVPEHLINYYDNITRLHMGEQYMYYNITTPNYLTDNVILTNGDDGFVTVESYGRDFVLEYGEQNFYIYHEELGGYVRITMDDVLNGDNEDNENN